jgi:glycyl-tRNA synthetase (class II)
MERRFEIEGEITRQYRRFNAVGTQLTVDYYLLLTKKIP